MFSHEHHHDSDREHFEHLVTELQVLKYDNHRVFLLLSQLMSTASDLATNVAALQADVTTLIAQGPGTTGAPLITQAQLDAANTALTMLDTQVKAALTGGSLAVNVAAQTVTTNVPTGVAVGDVLTIDSPNNTAAEETVSVATVPDTTHFSAIFTKAHTLPVSCTTASGVAFLITAVAPVAPVPVV